MSLNAWIQLAGTLCQRFYIQDTTAQEEIVLKEYARSEKDSAEQIINVLDFPFMQSVDDLQIAFSVPIVTSVGAYLLCLSVICVILMKHAGEKPYVCIMMLCQHLARALNCSL